MGLVSFLEDLLIFAIHWSLITFCCNSLKEIEVINYEVIEATKLWA